VLADAEASELVEPGWERRLEALQVEFTRLLSAPGSEAVPAHQSVYTDTLRLDPSGPDSSGCGLSLRGGEFQGYIGGESCSQARRWYEAIGYHPPDPAPAMADHIAAELGFLAHLYLCEAQALESGAPADAQAFRQMREEFGARFLGRWLNEFAERLAANPVSEIYRRVGSWLLAVAAAARR
jgi:TorA maturation chaperone TorD